MPIWNKVRTELLEPYGGRCPVCGRPGVTLEVCHIVPISAGGTDDIRNLAVMCRSCCASFDRYHPTEVEFTAFLAELLQRNPRFTDTRIEGRVSEDPFLTADLTTAERQDGKTRSVLIECKRHAFFTERRLRETIAQIEMYSARVRFDAYVLAFPGRIPGGLKALLDSHHIECWDIDFLKSTFADQISQSGHGYFKSLLMSVAPVDEKPPDITLLDRLRACEPGKKDWSEYQRVIGQTLERLFCPPLQPPLSESPDSAGINRRDFVLSNYADAGFWRFMRDMYKADYVVVDAKNYKAPVGKSQVLQIANYLKPHGAGLFAIIAGRAGADRAAQLTVREQWMSQKKMIIVLDDKAMEAMLLAASSGGDPTRVIGQLIEEFRLSM
jgi:hypothetical protein